MSWQPLALSFQVAVAATALAALVGVALAGVMAQTRFRGSDVLDVLITAPMVLPPTVLGYVLLHVIGRTSVLGQAWESLTGSSLVFSKSAAVLAGAIAAVPFIVKSARTAMDDVDPTLLGAAATLGAGPARVFFTVLLPLSRNGVLAGVTLGFARALGDFGVTLMIAGNLPGLTQTGALAIYDAVQANRDAEAGGLAAVLAGFAVVALYGATKLVRRRTHGW